MGDLKFENPQTANLNQILSSCQVLEEILFKIQEGGDEFIPVTYAKKGGQVINISTCLMYSV